MCLGVPASRFFFFFLRGLFLFSGGGRGVSVFVFPASFFFLGGGFRRKGRGRAGEIERYPQAAKRLRLNVITYSAAMSAAWQRFAKMCLRPSRKPHPVKAGPHYFVIKVSPKWQVQGQLLDLDPQKQAES